MSNIWRWREMTHWMNGINDLWESGYFDWQSGLARQALDEGKHAKVFCDVLIEKGLMRTDQDLYAGWKLSIGPNARRCSGR